MIKPMSFSNYPLVVVSYSPLYPYFMTRTYLALPVVDEESPLALPSWTRYVSTKRHCWPGRAFSSLQQASPFPALHRYSHHILRSSSFVSQNSKWCLPAAKRERSCSLSQESCSTSTTSLYCKGLVPSCLVGTSLRCTRTTCVFTLQPIIHSRPVPLAADLSPITPLCPVRHGLESGVSLQTLEQLFISLILVIHLPLTKWFSDRKTFELSPIKVLSWPLRSAKCSYWRYTDNSWIPVLRRYSTTFLLPLRST